MVLETQVLLKIMKIHQKFYKVIFNVKIYLNTHIALFSFMCLTCVEQIIHIPCNSKEPFRTPIILVPYTGSSLERTCPCKVMKALEENGSDSVPTCTQNCNSEK